MQYSWIWIFIVHIIVIVFHWIIKKPIHSLIILLVFTFFIVWGIYTSKTSINSDNNIKLIKNYSSCFHFKHQKIDGNKKYIILRLDDIQSYYLRDLSFKILNEAIKRDMPLTLAVIPLNLLDDNEMVDFLKENSCKIEIAQHGFNNRNDFPEFQDLPEAVADNKFKQGLKILNNISKKKIITFIPPENVYSTGSALSAKKNKFKIISWEWDALFDYSSTTYNFDTNKLNSVDFIINQCKKDAEIKWFSIIMIHPQDYIDENWNEDPVKYKEFIKLLDGLEKEWFEFTTMRDYYYFLNKNGEANNFYDSHTNKKWKHINSLLSNSWSKENNKITLNNYLKKSDVIFSPVWINNYNYITNDFLILKWNVDNNINSVYINDYKLTFFKPWDRQFNYILNSDYWNIIEWKNTYNIYFEKDWIVQLKESLVFYYNEDWRELWYYEEDLLDELNKKNINN